MAKIRKEFRLPDDVIKIIEQTKIENNFSTETEALVYILTEHKRQKELTISDIDKNEISDLVIEKFTAKYKRQLDRVRLASTFSERYSYMILDAINSILYEYGSIFLMKAQGETKHKVIRESEEQFKEMIERNKQIKDNDNIKRGES